MTDKKSSRSPLAQAESELKEAQLAIERGDVRDAQDSMEAFEEILDYRHNIPDQLEKRASDIRDEIATVTEAESLVSAAETLREESARALENDEVATAQQKASKGLKHCKDAAQLYGGTSIEDKSTINSIRTELKTAVSETKPIVDKIITARKHRKEVIEALERSAIEKAKSSLKSFDDQIKKIPECAEAERLREDHERLKELLSTNRTNSNLRSSLAGVDAEVSKAREKLEQLDIIQARRSLKKAKESVRIASKLSRESISDQQDRVDSRLDALESAEALVAKADKKLRATQQAFESGSYDAAETHVESLATIIDDISQHTLLSGAEGGLQSRVQELQDRVNAKQRRKELYELYESIDSARDRAETLIERGTSDEAVRQIESGLEQVKEAEELNEKHGFGEGERIGTFHTYFKSLLDTASTAAKQQHAAYVELAESKVEQGIQRREADNPGAAVNAFEEAQEQYTEAAELARTHELPELWETQERLSMVSEYLDIARSERDKRRRDTQNEIEQSLSKAEKTLTQVEQYLEVEDYVAARESVHQAADQLDDAAKLLNVEGVTADLRRRHEELTEQMGQFRRQLPEDAESGDYRNQDLVEHLQTLATKIAESPRPELVNEYGGYPADAYLEAFGSWGEALAAANLSPIEMTARERRKYTRVDILDELVEVANQLGREPSQHDMNTTGDISGTTVLNRFKDWETALEVADITHLDDSTEDAETNEGQDDQRSPEDTDVGSSILEQIEKEVSDLQNEDK